MDKSYTVFCAVICSASYWSVSLTEIHLKVLEYLDTGFATTAMIDIDCKDGQRKKLWGLTT